MKFARAAMGRNPLQNSLIDHEYNAIFGEPVSTAEAESIKGQQERVEAIMRDGYWHTVPELQQKLRRRFGQLYSETSISARIRAMRKRGYTVTHERTRSGSNLYQYRALKDVNHVERKETPAASTLETPPTHCTPGQPEAIMCMEQSGELRPLIEVREIEPTADRWKQFEAVIETHTDEQANTARIEAAL